MKRTLYLCRCGSMEHSFCVFADDEDLFLEIHLAPLPFWQRVRVAIGYIFGRRSRYGDFEEIILSPYDALILGDQLVEWSGRGTVDFKNNDVY